MMFKRKSVGSSPTKSEVAGSEARPRHRLQKPQTQSKSFANGNLLAAQQSASRSTVSITTEPPISPTTSLSAHREFKESSWPHATDSQIWKTTTIASEDDIALHGSPEVINATEDIHEKVDQDLTLSPSISSPKLRRPFSAIFASRRASNGQSGTLRNPGGHQMDSRSPSMKSLNGAEVAEEAMGGAPRTVERRASFTPGAATRMHKEKNGQNSQMQVENPRLRLHKPLSHDVAGSDPLCASDRACYYDITRSEAHPMSQIEELEQDWEAPPRITRTATPSDLDYTYLGGLSLGSLHVTNGRASPAPSELSRHLFMRRPSALLRRDVSSEYADSDIGSVAMGINDQASQLHNPPQLVRKQVETFELPYDTGVETSLQSQTPVEREFQRSREASWPMEHTLQSGNHLPSPDKASVMALAYMAEMPESPYSARRSTSPTGSVLKSTTKANEYEDGLFQDTAVDDLLYAESLRASSTPSDAASYGEDPVNMYIDSTDYPSQSYLRMPKKNSAGASDSGYSSNASLPSLREEAQSVAQRVKAIDERSNTQRNQIAFTDRGKADDRLLGPRPILKQNRAAASEIPTFVNHNPSMTSVATSQVTTATTSSTSSQPKESRKPKKLQKNRRSSQPVPPDCIFVQGSQALDEDAIPPIPADQRARLSARSQQFPELQRTFKSMHHTKDSASSFEHSITPHKIRFPSPGPDQAAEVKSSLGCFPPHRDSVTARARRSSNQARPSSGVSEAQALAIVQHFETNSTSLVSPYEIARNATSRPSSRGASPHFMKAPDNVNVGLSRPRSTMDDQTAVQYARSRSKSIAERDRQSSQTRSRSTSERRGSEAKRNSIFERDRQDSDARHRSGVGREEWELEARNSAIAEHERQDERKHESMYGRMPQEEEKRAHRFEHYRPYSTIGSASSLPQTPSRHDMSPYEWETTLEQRPFMDMATCAKMYWPEPQYSDPYAVQAPLPPRHSPRPLFVEPGDEVEGLCLAPPPPSHSPRPMTVSSKEDVQDVWAASAQAWRNRRKSIGQLCRRGQDFEPEHERQPQTQIEQVEEDQLYPAIPPRRPISTYARTADHWQVPRKPVSSGYSNAPSSEPQPLARPSSYSYAEEEYEKPQSRRGSQAPSLAGSYTGSLAEELHPPHLERPHPPPQFGRYSGGMEFGYEHGNGFGGSAGTRSFSGVAKASRKGVPLSTGFGVDLSDVPVSFSVQRV